MSSVVQAFPSFHGINGRSFALAFIIVLHVGFFYALSEGLVPPIPIVIKDDIEVVPIEDEKRVEESRPQQPVGPTIDSWIDIEPIPIPGDFEFDTDWVVPVQPDAHAGSGPTAKPDAQPAPKIIEPRIDPRVGLHEPVYPPPEIRRNHTGTVVLAVEVLPDGRIGAVRVVRSSGYPRLDEAAVQAAREWRLIPGTRDGVAVAMWKEIPITFRLKE